MRSKAVRGCRLTLVLAASAHVAFEAGLTGPIPPIWRGAEALGASYCLVLLAFASAPRSRRDDLALATACLAALVAGLSGALSYGTAFSDAALAIVGAAAAWAPGRVEGFRRDARHARRSRRGGAPARSDPLLRDRSGRDAQARAERGRAAATHV